MKVLNLRCAHHHAFEGWFASEDDYQTQLAGELVECPMCGDKAIARLPSAPRLNMMPRSRAPSGASEKTDAAPSPAPGASVPAIAAPDAASLQTLWLRAVRHVMANTDDVGERFAEEARRMHYGEAEERAIRGQASPEDTQALREEGIEVMSLPVPVVAKDTLQ